MALLWLILGLLTFCAAFVTPPLPKVQDIQQMGLLVVAGWFFVKWALATRKQAKRKARAKNHARPILIDGSNVMYWKDGQPNIQVVQKLVQALNKNGYHPGVIFDANAGYKLFDRYLDDALLARELGLSEDQVLVSPKGEPADIFLLNAARDMGAPIITNDRFRDWIDDFPEFSKPGRLIQGGYRKGAPYLKSKTA